jgi:hypothetical protein
MAGGHNQCIKRFVTKARFREIGEGPGQVAQSMGVDLGDWAE